MKSAWIRCFAWCLVFLWNSTLYAYDRGPVIFKRLCAQCHGVNGEGQKSIEAPSIAGLPEWYVNAQLKKFMIGARGLHPKDIAGTRMRPMAKTLTPEGDLDSVAKYTANLKVRSSPSTVVGGRPLKGEAVFATCSACHGADANGNQALNAPRLRGQNDWYMFTQLKNFKGGVRGGNAEIDPTGASMRAISLTLDEQAMKDVIAYISLMSVE